jgi:hypothetical protein
MKEYVGLYLRLALPFLFKTYTIFISKDVTKGQPDGELFVGHQILTVTDETGDQLRRIAVKHDRVTGLAPALRRRYDWKRTYRHDERVVVSGPFGLIDSLHVHMIVPFNDRARAV